MTAADQTPAAEAATAAQALAQAVREAAAENIPLRWLGKPDLASSYWDGYRAAAIELADLLDEPALLDQYPALGAKPAPQPVPAKRCGECRLGLGVHTPSDPYCDHHQTPATDSERVELARVIREVRTEHAADGMFALDDTLTVEDIVDSVLALDDEVTRLTALLAEQDATIERVRALVAEDYQQSGREVSCGGYLVTDDGCFAGSLARRIVAALGSQRTEGQG